MRIFGVLLLVLLAASLIAAEERISQLPPVATGTSPAPGAAQVEVPRTPDAPAKTKAPAPKRIVAIDVGHTRVSPGAISATGIPEYQFNLRVAERVRALLAATKTFEPFVISSEKAMSLVERTSRAAAHKADLFVSIHHDSAQDKYLKDWEVDGKEEKYADQFSGYSVFVSRKNPYFDESFALARGIGRAMAASGFQFATHHGEKIKGENRPIIDLPAGIYAFDDLVVLKTAPMPAVLVECGVILNRNEEKDLLTPERQITIAAAITRGIADYFAHAPAALPARAVIAKAPLEEFEATKREPSRLGAPLETEPGLHPTPRMYPKPGTPLKPEPVRSSEPLEDPQDDEDAH